MDSSRSTYFSCALLTIGFSGRESLTMQRTFSSQKTFVIAGVLHDACFVHPNKHEPKPSDHLTMISSNKQLELRQSRDRVESPLKNRDVLLHCRRQPIVSHPELQLST